MSKKNGIRARRLCFTYYPPSLHPESLCGSNDGETDAHASSIAEAERDGFCAAWVQLSSSALRYQVERCPSTKRHHYQGFSTFKSPVAFAGIMKVFPGIHLEVCKGTVADNLAYCSKEESRVCGPYGFGEFPVQGKRNDLAVVRALVDSGATMRDICASADVSGYQALRCAELLFKYKKPKLVPSRQVFWFYGSTGSGKTKTVHDTESDLWVNSIDCKWYDSYCGEVAALIDDYRPGDLSFKTMLRLLDVYPLRVPIKGGFVSWDPIRVYVTCPYSIEECFKARSDEDIGQLKRRVTEERLFGSVVLRKEYLGFSAPGFRSE